MLWRLSQATHFRCGTGMLFGGGLVVVCAAGLGFS